MLEKTFEKQVGFWVISSNFITWIINPYILTKSFLKGSKAKILYLKYSIPCNFTWFYKEGLIPACSRMGWCWCWGVGSGGSVGTNTPLLPKICHIYPTMMKLGSYISPKEDPKNIWITWYTPWVRLTSVFFRQRSANFAMSGNADIDCILIKNF